jgi:integrase
LILKAAGRLGFEIGGLDTMPSLDSHSQRPWRPRFDYLSLKHEERMLQAACYIVCAYLSGMRDSEIQAMRVGCYQRARSADGLIELHQIKSRVFKGRGIRGGQGQWITIAPVGKAIAILEQLTAVERTLRGSDALWQSLGERDGGRHLLGGTHILHLLNAFRDHVDELFGSPDTPSIPRADGQPWRFTTRQFRRTVAWYIANRPFGTVAGKIQYQHASIAMFEGYAGSAPSGLQREIDRERALGQLDDIVEHYEAFKRGMKPTGPAAARLLQEFKRVQKDLDDFPGRVVDRQRLRAMLKFFAKTLHVGHLNDCFFEPSTALCLERTGAKDRSAPRLSHCSPDRCPNSCISRRHLPPWERAIAETDTLLKASRLSPLQRRILLAERARIQALIAPLLE